MQTAASDAGDGMHAWARARMRRTWVCARVGARVGAALEEK